MRTVLVISWFATYRTYRLENPQLQIHRHCRRTIYVNVAWCKELWVRGWLTELTPQIVRHNRNHRAAATSISFNMLDLMHGDDFITLHLCRKSNAPVYISHLSCITHFTTGERLQKLHCKKKKKNSVTCLLMLQTKVQQTQSVLRYSGEEKHKEMQHWMGYKRKACVLEAAAGREYGCSLNVVTTQFQTIQAF